MFLLKASSLSDLVTPVNNLPVNSIIIIETTLTYLVTILKSKNLNVSNLHYLSLLS